MNLICVQPPISSATATTRWSTPNECSSWPTHFAARASTQNSIIGDRRAQADAVVHGRYSFASGAAVWIEQGSPIHLPLDLPVRRPRRGAAVDRKAWLLAPQGRTRRRRSRRLRSRMPAELATPSGWPRRRGRIQVRKPQIDQSAARSSMGSMRPRVASNATICAAACPAVCLSSPTISSGASGGS